MFLIIIVFVFSVFLFFTKNHLKTTFLVSLHKMKNTLERLTDGELYEYLLPVRGYSIKELEQMEEEKVEREIQLLSTAHILNL